MLLITAAPETSSVPGITTLSIERPNIIWLLAVIFASYPNAVELTQAALSVSRSALYPINVLFLFVIHLRPALVPNAVLRRPTEISFSSPTMRFNEL